MGERSSYGSREYGAGPYAGDLPLLDLGTGSSAGVSGASASLSVAHPLAGSSAGLSTVIGDLAVLHSLAGSSAGVSTASASIIYNRLLAGASNGVSTVSGSLVVAHPLAGSSAGASTVVGDLAVAHPLAGLSAGTSTATGNVSVAHPLAGSSAGASTASATLYNIRPLAGSSAGISSATADLTDTAPDYVLTPRLDAAVNSWTTDTGATTNLYAAISELVAVDTDYVQSPTGPSIANYYEANLETRPDPLSSSGHVAHYRYQKTGTAAMDLTVTLYDGATSIASWAHTNIGTSWVQQDQTLSGAQADAITNYDDLRFRFIPNQSVSQALPPDALLLQTNLVGSLSAVTDDPDAPDATWLTASSTTVASILRVSFATPVTTPATGAGLQQFHVWVRKTSASGTPTTTIELWESSSLKSTPLATTNITSTTGQILSATWDASTLTTGSGANVELRLTGTVGGSGGNRATMEVGAVEWIAAFPTGKAQVSWANFELPTPAVVTSGSGWNMIRR